MQKMCQCAVCDILSGKIGDALRETRCHSTPSASLSVWRSTPMDASCASAETTAAVLVEISSQAYAKEQLPDSASHSHHHHHSPLSPGSASSYTYLASYQHKHSSSIFSIPASQQTLNDFQQSFHLCNPSCIRIPSYPIPIHSRLRASHNHPDEDAAIRARIKAA